LKFLGVEDSNQEKSNDGFISNLVNKTRKAYIAGSTKFQIILTKHGLNLIHKGATEGHYDEKKLLTQGHVPHIGYSSCALSDIKTSEKYAMDSKCTTWIITPIEKDSYVIE